MQETDILECCAGCGELKAHCVRQPSGMNICPECLGKHTKIDTEDVEESPSCGCGSTEVQEDRDGVWRCRDCRSRTVEKIRAERDGTPVDTEAFSHRKEASSIQFNPAQPNLDQTNPNQLEKAVIEKEQGGDTTGAETRVNNISALYKGYAAEILVLPKSIMVVRPRRHLTPNVRQVLTHMCEVFALWYDSGRLRTEPLAYPLEDLAERLYGDRSLFPLVRSALAVLDEQGICVLWNEDNPREGDYHRANLYVLVEPLGSEDSFEVELDPHVPTI